MCASERFNKMIELKATITYVLLLMFASTFAQEATCPLCPPGFYITKNCSGNVEIKSGIKCVPCTNCSEFFQDTLAPCSAYADTKCGQLKDKGVAKHVWILSGVFASVFLVMLALFLRHKFFAVKAKFSELASAKTASSEMKNLCLPETTLQVCTA